MEKYGFVYIWFDRKRKMYYIGCRWGSIEDNYICSSNRMRDAYRRRPHDFKRRILKMYINREHLLDEEHKWLSLIPENDLGKKYYNLRKHRWGHWSSDVQSRLTVGQKISASPERAKKISIANKGKKPDRKTTEAAIKSLKGRTYEEIYGEDKARELRALRKTALLGRKHTKESIQKMKDAKK